MTKDNNFHLCTPTFFPLVLHLLHIISKQLTWIQHYSYINRWLFKNIYKEVVHFFQHVQITKTMIRKKNNNRDHVKNLNKTWTGVFFTTHKKKNSALEVCKIDGSSLRSHLACTGAGEIYRNAYFYEPNDTGAWNRRHVLCPSE